MATQKAAIKKKGWLETHGKYKMAVPSKYMSAVKKGFFTFSITTNTEKIDFSEIKFSSTPQISNASSPVTEELVNLLEDFKSVSTKQLEASIHMKESIELITKTIHNLKS